MQHLNPYVHAYRHMYAVTRNCGGPAELRFHFATGITPDPQRYNAATPSSEVAVVYTGDKPPCHGLMVYPYPQKSGAYTHRANYLSDHVDPIAYPLLFLDGQHGWHPQLRTVTIEGRGPEQRSKISQREFFTHRLMQRAPVGYFQPTDSTGPQGSKRVASSSPLSPHVHAPKAQKNSSTVPLLKSSPAAATASPGASDLTLPCSFCPISPTRPSATSNFPTTASG